MKTGVLKIPAPVRMTHCPPRLQLHTFWMGVILTEKMTFWGDKCLTKVDHALKIGILNIPAPFRVTPCPRRLQIQSLWMWVNLTRKMTFLGDKRLTNWWFNENRCPEHPSSCQDDPLSSQTPILNFVVGGHLDKENEICKRQVLNNSIML